MIYWKGKGEANDVLLLLLFFSLFFFNRKIISNKVKTDG